MNHPPYRTMILLLTMVLLTASGYLFAGGHQEQENTPPSAAKETISIIDQTGREVSVPKEVRRIVTIPIPAASMLIAIDGGTERLVGMHPKSKSALEEGILKEFYPEALRINSEVVGDGFMPNVEAMLALNPDLIFQWGHLGVDVVEPLENAGLNVALLLYGSQENLEGWIHDFGLLLDKEEKAQKSLRGTMRYRKKSAAQWPRFPKMKSQGSSIFSGGFRVKPLRHREPIMISTSTLPGESIPQVS